MTVQYNYQDSSEAVERAEECGKLQGVAFSCSPWDKHTDPQVDHVKTVRDVGVLSPKWDADAFIKALSVKS